MFRVKFLRNLLIISLSIAILLPLYQFFIVHPSYNKLLIKEVEDDAVRYASYMARTLEIDNRPLLKDLLPENLEQKLKPVNRDKRLIKLRIFSAAGEIIFSTEADEIGDINEKTYFREIVANGRVYSKIVNKDNATAEGTIAKIDIVETYVPFVNDRSFSGAFEVYYDVTKSVAQLDELSKHSMATIFVMSAGFLIAIYFALYRAYVNFQERAAAELALHAANEDLERRVEERTRELSDANEQLTAQIAERARAQIALGEAMTEIKLDREKLNGILSSVPDGVVVTDNDLNVLHMNAAAESILDAPLRSVLGKSIDTLGKDVGFVKKIGQRLNNIHGSRSFDFEVAGVEGRSSRVYSVRISQLVTDGPEASGVILLICDVTRERDVERMKSAFLGMAAHELNTPLTTIIGYTELLTTEETAINFTKEQQQEYLNLVHNKALSLAGLIDDLLDISRIESGRELALHYDTFSVDTLIREVVDASSESSEDHQVDIELPNVPAMICADQARLEQAIGHLLSNAIKYTPGGGRVRIALTEDSEMYMLVVDDEGIGMNEEQLAHIFDRFYRADSADTAVQGVGLGMSIVRHIVLAHFGSIKVDSELGNGTRVTITLPKAPATPQERQSRPFAS